MDLAIQKRDLLDFEERTNRLAEKVGCRLEDLTELLGFSRASLFAYRSGRNKVSRKAWRSLEEAERRVGIPVPERLELQDSYSPDVPQSKQCRVPGMYSDKMKHELKSNNQAELIREITKLQQTIIDLQQTIIDLQSQKISKSEKPAE